MLDGLNQNDLKKLIEFIRVIEDAAKSRGNALEKLDLTWLNQYLEDADTDSPFLIQLKSHARDELGILPFVKLINKCKDTVSFIKRTSSMELFEVTLKQECETRWNSVYMCLESFTRNFSQVCSFLFAKISNAWFKNGIEDFT